MVPTFALAMWHALVFFAQGRPVFAPKFVVEWRRAKCGACRENLNGQCLSCLCLWEPKTILSSESCPRKYWLALTSSKKSLITQ
jgi:hypothetical protein